MDGIPVMDAAEGAAWRVQLDAMWAVLAPYEGLARSAGDGAVTRLLKSVQAARQAAITVERRSETTTVYRGVSLVKR